MDRTALLKKIRVYNLRHWAEKLDRNVMASKAGYDDTVLLNQLVTGKGSFGNAVAKKYEDSLGLPPLWLDTPHPGLWTEEQRNELEPYLSSAQLSSSLIDLSNDSANSSIADFLEHALSLVKDNKEE